MTFPRFTSAREEQAGFTLVELLIAIALVGLTSLGITGAIIQVLTINTRASNHMIAVRQVQQAGKEVSKDALQARNVTCGGSNGFSLTLAWEDWEGTDNVVVYTIEDDELQRSHDIEGVRVIARYIDLDHTSCDWNNDTRVLIFTVTAIVGNGPQQASETRVYEVEPRPTG